MRWDMSRNPFGKPFGREQHKSQNLCIDFENRRLYIMLLYSENKKSADSNIKHCEREQ